VILPFSVCYIVVNLHLNCSHLHYSEHFLWPPYVIGQAIIFLPCGFFFLFLLFFPRLISAWCGLNANLECRSETCCARLAENTGCKKSPKKWPVGHHPTTLSGYIFATKACFDDRKKNLLSSNISSTCPPQYGELRPTSGWDHFVSFVRFCVLAALLHRTLVVGVSQTLRRWTEGTSYIRKGGHHVGHWPTF